VKNPKAIPVAIIQLSFENELKNLLSTGIKKSPQKFSAIIGQSCCDIELYIK
jgi:hypothetical protein